MKNMMSQVKNSNHALSLLIGRVGVGLLLVCALALTGCEQDPFKTPGKVEDPQWKVTVDNNLSASMTAVVKVSFSESQGTLAAFIGDACCGVAEYLADENLYFLYITPPTENGGDVLLRFYSPELKRIFDANATVPFVNDTQLGTVATPFTPTFVVAK